MTSTRSPSTYPLWGLGSCIFSSASWCTDILPGLLLYVVLHFRRLPQTEVFGSFPETCTFLAINFKQHQQQNTDHTKKPVGESILHDTSTLFQLQGRVCQHRQRDPPPHKPSKMLLSCPLASTPPQEVDTLSTAGKGRIDDDE